MKRKDIHQRLNQPLPTNRLVLSGEFSPIILASATKGPAVQLPVWRASFTPTSSQSTSSGSSKASTSSTSCTIMGWSHDFLEMRLFFAMANALLLSSPFLGEFMWLLSYFRGLPYLPSPCFYASIFHGKNHHVSVVSGFSNWRTVTAPRPSVRRWTPPHPTHHRRGDRSAPPPRKCSRKSHVWRFKSIETIEPPHVLWLESRFVWAESQFWWVNHYVWCLRKTCWKLISKDHRLSFLK